MLQTFIYNTCIYNYIYVFFIIWEALGSPTRKKHTNMYQAPTKYIACTCTYWTETCRETNIKVPKPLIIFLVEGVQ